MADSKIIKNNDEAWRRILDDHPDIERKCERGGIYEISADEIKRYREPRLMTKFDTSLSVAEPLRKRHLNVLPLSRSSYGIGRFELYEQFPDVSDEKPHPITLPDYETLTTDSLTSESNAINALLVSHALEEFLGEEDCGFVETFNGRMGTSAFDFDVSMFGSGQMANVKVDRAQLEIDGGFESAHSVTIMEAKNIRHDDFNVRQLYFPFRKYYEFVKKPIRLVFSQYTNLTYHLYEYRFADFHNYSSIQLICSQAYTFEDRQITMSDLQSVLESITEMQSDDQAQRDIPTFPQADCFDRITSLVERLDDAPDGSMTIDEVTEFMGTVRRQAYYYLTAGVYLGLFDRSEPKVISLTPRARTLLKKGYRERQLGYARLILEHQIFNELFRKYMSSGFLPERKYVIKRMIELNVCNDKSTVGRRAQTVLAWLRWIISLADED